MRKVYIVLAAVLLILAVGGLVYWLERPTTGLEPIVWDRSSCSHCHMHIGDPNFASQLQTTDGEVHNFDDTGCLFEWREEHQPSVREVFFHHYQREQWLTGDQVGFVRIDEDTPMGYGLGAVSRAEQPEAMGLEEAARTVLEMRRPHEQEPEPTTRH